MILLIDKFNVKHIELLQTFIKTMGDSSLTFRYFSSRPISIIHNHICTLLFMLGEYPVGYGHLDKEGNHVWLGIAIADGYTGNGYGKQIMNNLIDVAIKNNVSSIQLSVDKHNQNAIQLYKRFNFVQYHHTENTLFFVNKLSNDQL
jgi:GNAT superfamily N-acetyltransferase